MKSPLVDDLLGVQDKDIAAVVPHKTHATSEAFGEDALEQSSRSKGTSREVV